MENTLKLIEALELAPNSQGIFELIKLAENESSVDVTKQLDQLRDGWKLRWSSSNLNSKIIRLH